MLEVYDLRSRFNLMVRAHNGQGNKPPWTLPAKAKYSTYDADRARKYFGVTETSTPDFFPIL